jgi:hypothetical protein
VQVHDLPALHVAENTRNRFPACANALTNLSMCERDMNPDTVLRFLRARCPLQQKAGKFCGDSQSHAHDAPALMLVAARLRHVAATKWGTKRYLQILGDHPKAAIDYHFKTGHTETA